MHKTSGAPALLGLALRAGRLAVGDDPVHDLIGSGHARAVFLACDAGAGIVKKITRHAQERGIALLTLPEDKAALGRALGRASCAVCATSDPGFAAGAAKKLAGLSPQNQEAADRLAQKHERILSRRAKPRKKDAGHKIETYIDILEEDLRRETPEQKRPPEPDHK